MNDCNFSASVKAWGKLLYGGPWIYFTLLAWIFFRYDHFTITMRSCVANARCRPYIHCLQYLYSKQLPSNRRSSTWMRIQASLNYLQRSTSTKFVNTNIHRYHNTYPSAKSHHEQRHRSSETKSFTDPEEDERTSETLAEQVNDCTIEFYNGPKNKLSPPFDLWVTMHKIQPTVATSFLEEYQALFSSVGIQLWRVLGQGSYATVFEATRYPSGKQRFAIRCVQSLEDCSADSTNNLGNEVSLQRRLSKCGLALPCSRLFRTHKPMGNRFIRLERQSMDELQLVIVTSHRIHQAYYMMPMLQSTLSNWCDDADNGDDDDNKDETKIIRMLSRDLYRLIERLTVARVMHGDLTLVNIGITGRTVGNDGGRLHVLPIDFGKSRTDRVDPWVDWMDLLRSFRCHTTTTAKTFRRQTLFNALLLRFFGDWIPTHAENIPECVRSHVEPHKIEVVVTDDTQRTQVVLLNRLWQIWRKTIIT